MRKPGTRRVKKGGAPATPAASQLPNAPLVEVVFELRWRLIGNEHLPPPFRTDPGLLPLLHAFASKADKLGFPNRLDMARPEEAMGHAVTTRFRKSAEAAFPLLQVGSGIFAANDGPLYEWKQFKAHALAGTLALIESYPRLPGFEFTPIYMELRYIDVFDEPLLNTPDLLNFLAKGTSLEINAPPFVYDLALFLEEPLQGRFALQGVLRGWPNSAFAIEVASATNTKTSRPAFRLQSKVATEAAGLPKLDASFRGRVTKWLEFAHGLTSPFFRSFINGNLMSQFEATPK